MAIDLTVICGKGGVGKTTLALATAVAESRKGRRILVVSSHPIPELSLSLSLDGLEDEFPEIAARLYVVHIEPKSVLKSLVRARVRPQALGETLVSSRVYQSFVEVVPGLKEFAFLWRLKELAETPVGHQLQTFDALVWDAPATGHFLDTLRVAANFQSFFSGPLATQARAISDFLQTNRMDIVPVCIAEEMSVDETLELLASLRKLDLEASRILCNLASPLLVEWVRTEGVEDLAPAAGTPVADFLRVRLESEVAEFRRLLQARSISVRAIQRIPRGRNDLHFLIGLADCLGNGGL